jgi:hypothetical protein
MNDYEKTAFVMEAAMWLPYIYFRKIMQAHVEYCEDLFL